MISLIVVDYNSIDETIKFIKMFLEKLKSVHIVIVQNGTSPNDLDKLTNEFGVFNNNIECCGKNVSIHNDQNLSICYCFANDNLGYAKGNNLGASIAKELWNDPYLLISNNDIIVDNVDFFKITEIFNNDSSIGIIGPRVVSVKGVDQSPYVYQSAFKRLYLYYLLRWISVVLPQEKKEKFLVKHTYDVNHNIKNSYCDYVSGCFMFIKSSAFFEVGMFDDYTFLYGEEIILSKRMKNNNYNTYYASDFSVIHNHAVTTKKYISDIRNKKIEFRSMYHYYKKYDKTNPLLLWISKANFLLYINCNSLLHKIKNK